jgi:hypothetical protein
MGKGRVKAMLKHSRKKLMQRKGKLLKKHAGETWKPEPPCPYDLGATIDVGSAAMDRTAKP